MARREPRIQNIKGEKKSHLGKISKNLIFLEMLERERERGGGGGGGGGGGVKNPLAVSRVSLVGSSRAQSKSSSS